MQKNNSNFSTEYQHMATLCGKFWKRNLSNTTEVTLFHHTSTQLTEEVIIKLIFTSLQLQPIIFSELWKLLIQQ